MLDGYIEPASPEISFQEKAYKWGERCIDFFNEFTTPSKDVTRANGKGELRYDTVSIPDGSFGTMIPGFGEDDNYKLFKMLEEGVELYKEGRRFENVKDKMSGEVLERGMEYLNDIMLGISAKFVPIAENPIGAEKYAPAIWSTNNTCTEERKKYWTASIMETKTEGNMEQIEKPEYSTPFTDTVNSWVEDMEFFASRYMEGNELDSKNVIQRDGYETLKWFGESDPEEFAELIERGTELLIDTLTEPHAMEDGEFWDPFGDLYVSEGLTKRFENAVTKLAKLYGKCSGVPIDGCEDVSVISRIKRAASIFSQYQGVFVTDFKVYRDTFEKQPNNTKPSPDTKKRISELMSNLLKGEYRSFSLIRLKELCGRWELDESLGNTIKDFEELVKSDLEYEMADEMIELTKVDESSNMIDLVPRIRKLKEYVKHFPDTMWNYTGSIKQAMELAKKSIEAFEPSDEDDEKYLTMVKKDVEELLDSTEALVA